MINHFLVLWHALSTFCHLYHSFFTVHYQDLLQQSDCPTTHSMEYIQSDYCCFCQKCNQIILFKDHALHGWIKFSEFVLSHHLSGSKLTLRTACLLSANGNPTTVCKFVWWFLMGIKKWHLSSSISEKKSFYLLQGVQLLLQVSSARPLHNHAVQAA